MKEPGEHLFVKYEGGKIVGYAYGEEWVAAAMYVDDICYPTPEEAKAAWEKEKSELIQHVGYSPEQMGYDK